MTNTIKVALIGAGFAGQAHAFGWRNASMAIDLSGTRIELDSVVDPNLELARSVAARFGFRTATDDIEQILRDQDIIAVSVAVPNHLSADVVASLLAAGKHILCEKPLGKNASEARRLADLAAKSSVVTAVNFSYRRIPGLAAARRAVQDGLIGTPYFARAHFYADYAADPATPMAWRYDHEFSGGGTLMDMGAHAVDALESIVGKVDEVSSATFSTVIPERSVRDGGTAPVTTEDTALVSLRLAGGAVASVLTSRVAHGTPCEMGVEIFGSAGHVSFTTRDFDRFVLYQTTADSEFDAPREVLAGPRMPYFADVSAMPAHGVATGYNEAFVAQVQDFVRAVTTGAPLDTTFEAAAKTMAVLEEAASHAGASAWAPVS